MLPPKPKCVCEEYNLEKGNALYKCDALKNFTGIELGFAFVEISIRFCPACGKELKGEENEF